MGRRRAFYVGLGSSALLAGVCGSASLPVATGCYTHQCDSSSYDLGPDDAGRGPGNIVDENTWESNGLDQTWLPYPHMVTVNFRWPTLFQGRTPISVVPSVGVSDQPNEPLPDGGDFVGGDNWTPASGQLALMYFANGNGVSITNGTCADYFLRVVATFAPVAAGPSPADAAPGAITDATGVVDSAGGGKPGN